MDNTFGELVRSFREARGLTQTELAKRLEVTRGALSNWESDKNRPRDRKFVVKLAKLLAVSKADTDRLLQTANFPPEYLFTKPQFTAPPSIPQYPPECSDFVGREAELTYYLNKLKKDHIAVIYGMPRIGKTTLATVLASQAVSKKKLFWHRFVEGEEIASIIWEIAAFLAWNGLEDLWKTLYGIQVTSGKLPPIELLFGSIVQLSRGKGFLFLLDNFHFVDKDPLIEPLITQLLQPLRGGELSLIITSREKPASLKEIVFEPLAGLSEANTSVYLKRRGVSLSEKLNKKLFEISGGNPQFLSLAIYILQKRTKPAQAIIVNLGNQQNVADYMVQEVDKYLQPVERVVLQGVALMLGHPVQQETIEIILDIGSVQKVLLELVRRDLLGVHINKAGKTYSLHDLLRDYFYISIETLERKALHQRAGVYFEGEVKDHFFAAIHFERAGNFDQAAYLITDNVEAILNKGHTRSLRRLIKQINIGRTHSELWTHLKITQGYIDGRLGEEQLAQNSYQEAMIMLETFPDSPKSRALQALACYRMGELLQTKSPPQALEWVGRGLDILGDSAFIELANLYLLRGNIAADQGNYQTAFDQIHKGLKLLPPYATPSRIHALSVLMMIHSARGNTREGIRHLELALTLSEEIGDHFRKISIMNNLSILKFLIGDWKEGVVICEQAIRDAEKLGNHRQKIDLEINRGWMYIQQGEDEKAEQFLVSAFDQGSKIGLRDAELFSVSNLADLSLRQGELEKAENYLNRAEQLSRDLEIDTELPEIYRNRASLFLKLKRLPDALASIQSSLQLAEEMDVKRQRGMSLRVLGQIQIDQKDYEPAFKSFEESATLLLEDPYEKARTQVQLAAGLLEKGNIHQTRELLEKAKITLRNLGARRDICIVNEILARF